MAEIGERIYVMVNPVICSSMLNVAFEAVIASSHVVSKWSNRFCEMDRRLSQTRHRSEPRLGLCRKSSEGWEILRRCFIVSAGVTDVLVFFFAPAL